MAKTSDSIYKETRKAKSWSRERAAEMLAMSDDKLERIENGRQLPTPQDVLNMASVYGAPELCNSFCHNDCEIGKQYVPEIELASLPETVLRLLDSLHDAEDIERLLIKITADDVISDEEIPDIISIQSQLNQLASLINALQFCVERKVASNELSKELYDKQRRL